MLQHIKDDIPVRLGYSSLYHFFDVFPLPLALQRVDQLVYTACANHSWRKSCPADLLFFSDHLQELCRAAAQLYQYDHAAYRGNIDTPETGMPDITQTQQYLYPKYMLSPWECMPRHLSIRQYHQPGRALAKFVQLMPETSWQSTIKELLEFALCNDSIEGGMPLSQVLKVRKRLLQLLEACHLIVVRTGGDEPGTKGKE